MGLEFREEIQARQRSVGGTSTEIILKVMRPDEITKRVDSETKEVLGLRPGALQCLEVKEMRGKKKKRP